MNKIRYAEKNEYEEIKYLFNECFPEDIDFNEYFFKNFFNINNTIVCEKDGQIVSMLQNIPYEINGIGNVSYIYGACTLKEYQGKGLMGKLIETAFLEDIKNNRKASILIPAERSLFNFYKRFGYEANFYVNNENIKCNGDPQKYKLEEVSEDYIEYMNDLYERNNKIYFVKRNYDYWKNQINLFKQCGGNVFIIKNSENNADGYAFCWNTEVITVQEIICSDIKDACEAISVFYGRNDVKYLTVGEKTAFGCIKKYENMIYDEKMYMNLMYN